MKCESCSKNIEKPEIKIFQGTVKSALKQCLDEGYRPATLKEVYHLKKEKKIEDKWYNVGTIYLEGEVRGATLDEYKNIEKIYSLGGRVLFLVVDDGLSGSVDLDSIGRFVGVAPEVHK